MRRGPASVVVVAAFGALGACLGDQPETLPAGFDGRDAGAGSASDSGSRIDRDATTTTPAEDAAEPVDSAGGGADVSTGEHDAGSDAGPTLSDAGTDAATITDAGSVVDAARPCYPSPSGQLAWWTADSSLADRKGNYPFTVAPLLPGGSVELVAGKVAQAFDLKDAYLLSDPVTLLFTEGYTVEGWMNARSNLGSIAGANYQGIATILISFTHETTLSFRIGSTNVEAPAPPANEWVHLAGTWEGTTNHQTHLYVNGVEVGVSQAQTVGVNADRLKLGGAGPFAGLLDEWAMYGRALLKSELQAIVAAGPSGRCKN